MFHSRKPARRPTSWLNRRPRFEVLEDRTVPSTLYVDDSLVAGTPIGSLPASVQVTDDRDGSGTLTTGDRVSIAVGETGTTTRLTFNEARHGGDVGSAYSTIGDAIAAANPGDIIEIAAGTYTEAVAVDKRVSLDGLTNNAADVVISPTTGDGVTISASGATLSDLTVSAAAGAGVTTSGSAVGDLILQNVAVNTTGGNAGLTLTGSGAPGSILSLNGVTATVGSGGTGAALTVSGFDTVNLINLSVPDVSGAGTGSITFPSGSSAATLNVSTPGSTPTTFTVSPTSLQLGPTSGTAGAPITLADVDRLNLNGGSGADTFDITPAPTGGAVITVNGGAPNGGTTGDVLNLASGTITAVKNLTSTANGLAGTYLFSDAANVVFSGIESLANVAVITGKVFNDLNGNGTPDTGELGVPGVPVQLFFNGNTGTTPDLTTTTNALGNFAFAVLPADAGSVTVKIVPPTGDTTTTSATQTATAKVGQITQNVNFGLQRQSTGGQTSTVTGVVFNDINGNGVQDTGEVGINNLVVFLDLNGNGKLNDDEPATLTSTVGGVPGSFTLTSDAVGMSARLMVVQKPGYLRNTNSPLVNLTAGETETADVGVRANLPPQATPARLLAVGVVEGNAAKIRVFDQDGKEDRDIPVAGNFPGGLRVTTADVNGDGVPDFIVATGPGSQATIIVIDGSTQQEILRINPFDSFTGGAFVTTGDVTGDGIPDLLITPDQGGGPRVVVVRGGDLQTVLSFFGIDDASFRGGARAAVADINGDGIPDVLVAAGFGGGPRVSVFDGHGFGKGQFRHLMNDFFAFENTLRNGVFLSGGDVDGDGDDDLVIGAGPGGGPRVMVLSGAMLTSQGAASAINSPLLNFFGGDPNNRGGIAVSAKDLDGNGRADIITGDGSGGQVTAYDHHGKQKFHFDAGDDHEGKHGVFVG